MKKLRNPLLWIAGLLLVIGAFLIFYPNLKPKEAVLVSPQDWEVSEVRGDGDTRVMFRREEGYFSIILSSILIEPGFSTSFTTVEAPLNPARRVRAIRFWIQWMHGEENTLECFGVRWQTWAVMSIFPNRDPQEQTLRVVQIYFQDFVREEEQDPFDYRFELPPRGERLLVEVPLPAELGEIEKIDFSVIDSWGGPCYTRFTLSPILAVLED